MSYKTNSIRSHNFVHLKGELQNTKKGLLIKPTLTITEDEGVKT